LIFNITILLEIKNEEIIIHEFIKSISAIKKKFENPKIYRNYKLNANLKLNFVTQQLKAEMAKQINI